jgi:hypothetical protein
MSVVAAASETLLMLAVRFANIFGVVYRQNKDIGRVNII